MENSCFNQLVKEWHNSWLCELRVCKADYAIEAGTKGWLFHYIAEHIVVENQLVGAIFQGSEGTLVFQKVALKRATAKLNFYPVFFAVIWLIQSGRCIFIIELIDSLFIVVSSWYCLFRQDPWVCRTRVKQDPHLLRRFSTKIEFSYVGEVPIVVERHWHFIKIDPTNCLRFNLC